MALEIERRFLVQGDDWRQHIRWQAWLQQGYLVAAADGVTVRVRSASGVPAVAGAWLTLKARPGGLPAAAVALPEGLVRHEFEYPIPAGDAEALLALAPQRLSKWRYGLDLPGGEWVLDVFEAENAPLVVAEVELAPATWERSLVELEPPAWCVRELTGRHELSNAALARSPLAHWPEAQRRELLEAVR
ncbi:CYTH domain-containing protein [Cyanobium sp. Alchichica 3B3-8F6]|uniref:CYTH domain-containing protein n=1 Tax=Synechococcales TaxID=1890424 RepID=UPI000B996CD9|nr:MULTISPECIES: CYTH domain-containing protein [Synechococcales]MCP9882309.1 CYTH domain-containing protein [Cyanobium sp. Alchichica 3B3-8F6]